MNMSDIARQILMAADDASKVYNNRYIGPEHLLYGLLQQDSFVDVFEHFGADAEDAKKYLEDEVFFKAEKKKNPQKATVPTADYKWVMGRAEEMAKFNGGDTIIASHIALALLELNDCVVSCYLESELDIDDFRTAVAHMQMGDEGSFNKVVSMELHQGDELPLGLGGLFGLMFGGFPGMEAAQAQQNAKQQKKPELKYLAK